MKENAVKITRDCSLLSTDFIVQKLHKELGDVIGKTAKSFQGDRILSMIQRKWLNVTNVSANI